MTFRDEGFFLALQQEPDDDALRLIYADFLQENGDDAAAAHAELIRVQVELAALAPISRQVVERFAELTARQNELLARWERVWLGDWADVLDGWTFRRGFVEAVRADAAVFLDHAQQWFAEWPALRVAKLARAGGHLAELAASPWLAHLRGLDLSDNGIDTAALAHLTASRFICLLQALDLSGNPIGPRGAALIANARWADDLSELHLARCELGGKGVRGEALVGLLGGRSRQWRRLHLSNNALCRRELVRLVDSPVMPSLTALDLALNPLSDNGAAVLADSPNAAGLVHLGLCSTETGNLGLTALAQSPHLKNLRSLDLRCHNCWPDLDRAGEDRGGIGELARSPLLGQLRRLLLDWSRHSNGWTAEVLGIVRPAKRPEVAGGCWVVNQLRKSRYLMPSQLIECDLEELWWLGDTRNRERLPNPWSEDYLGQW
jgi:uncharacterized protein (TIGR02996 family)